MQIAWRYYGHFNNSSYSNQYTEKKSTHRKYLSLYHCPDHLSAFYCLHCEKLFCYSFSTWIFEFCYLEWIGFLSWFIFQQDIIGYKQFLDVYDFFKKKILCLSWMGLIWTAFYFGVVRFFSMHKIMSYTKVNIFKKEEYFVVCHWSLVCCMVPNARNSYWKIKLQYTSKLLNRNRTPDEYVNILALNDTRFSTYVYTYHVMTFKKWKVNLCTVTGIKLLWQLMKNPKRLKRSKTKGRR